MSRRLSLCLLILLGACATAPPPVVFGPPGDPMNPPQGPYQPNAYLRVCPGMTVSNHPPMDHDRWVNPYNPIIVVNGIVLATVPANDVCLTSGFGPRYGRMHEGIDLQSRPAGPVYATAPGRVVEARVSSSYGNVVLLDHGNGVYTRYAHLDFIDPYVVPGVDIGFGQPIGMMGQTGNAQAIHVHYEILTGNIRNPKGSKGLQVHDPFVFPPWIPTQMVPAS